jgi:hypothetical protein
MTVRVIEGPNGKIDRRLRLELEFDGLPPEGEWEADVVLLRCAECGASVRLIVR